MNIHEEERDALKHYGILRKSGRYPWDSGETPHERSNTFLSLLSSLRAQGLSDKEIAQGFEMNTTQLRETVTIANQVKKAGDIARAQFLQERGNSNVAIGKIMGIGESSVRDLLRDSADTKNQILVSTVAMLRDQVAKHKYIDVGKGVELHLGISHEKLRTARKLLEDEGYKLWYVRVPQLGTGKMTTVKVLAAPDSDYKDVKANQDKIVPAQLKSTDGGKSYDPILPPKSIDSKRVKVRYAEEGGTDADGVMYVRPGVKDVSLGGAHYAQVRVAVDDTHYLKGMAIYGDAKDFPPGVDIIFNTNKSSTGNKLDAMKEIDRKKNPDPADPFGATVSEQIYRKHPDGSEVRDSNGNRIVESTMNIVNKEGKWDDWSKNLSSQMLSKQKPTLIKNQLDETFNSKMDEFNKIMGLTNPSVRAHLLEKFADSADASAVHLKAAHMPRQATKVILPVNSLKDNEVYAPTFRDGETVVLIRFPHGGIFEIPELKVNNRHPQARKLLGTDAPDAIGINSKVAERLSGADFDGDTVLVIPNNQGHIRTAPPLEGLKDFDPKTAYPAYEGMPRMNAKQKGMEMGKVSNLITDMHLKGAPFSEIERAVKHSMVVIDAEKHNLNYKLSAQQNGISALMKKYQDGKAGGGASTIVSKATADIRVDERKRRPASEGGWFDKKTGKLAYVETGNTYSDGTRVKQISTKLAETDDAHTLSSGTVKEKIYADHSNRLKDLANQARRELGKTKALEYSPSANKAYAEEVKRLQGKLNTALKNAPLERRAQIIANAAYELKREANPDADKAELKKMKAKELTDARLRVGAGRDLIDITPREWEAIQAGAVTKTMLKKILENTDVDKVKELATPKEKVGMNPSMLRRAMAMLDNNSTLADVADQLGISVSTLKRGLKEASTGE